jgi:hypothetical protein
MMTDGGSTIQTIPEVARHSLRRVRRIGLHSDTAAFVGTSWLVRSMLVSETHKVNATQVKFRHNVQVLRRILSPDNSPAFPSDS